MNFHERRELSLGIAREIQSKETPCRVHRNKRCDNEEDVLEQVNRAYNMLPRYDR